jgi:N-acetyl-gamma-glutamyl-phosphate reductase
MKAAILGATGYAGTEIFKILLNHPQVSELFIVSSTKSGEQLSDVFRMLQKNSLNEKTKSTAGKIISLEEALDLKPAVIFSALPHKSSAEACCRFVEKSLVIDLSADFRFKNKAYFETAYGFPHLELSKNAVYGLAEWASESIKACNLIANPGCYTTASLLPLLPLVKEKVIGNSIVINALSGISGAGKKPEEKYLFSECVENLTAYAPGMSHRHSYEILEQLENEGFKGKLLFNPHLVPVKRGIFAAITAELTKKQTSEDILSIYQKYYSNKPCITINKNAIPQTKDVWGSNCCAIGWHIEAAQIIVFSVIDNLIKGAAGQAVQNMNICLGFPETLGLNLNSLL